MTHRKLHEFQCPSSSAISCHAHHHNQGTLQQHLLCCPSPSLWRPKACQGQGAKSSGQGRGTNVLPIWTHFWWKTPKFWMAMDVFVGYSKFMNFNQLLFNSGRKPHNKDIITADSTAIATTCNHGSPVELTPAGTKVPAWSTVAVTDWMWHPRGHRVPPIASQSGSCFVLNPDQA